jgi:predicted transcriptional regulator
MTKVNESIMEFNLLSLYLSGWEEESKKDPEKKIFRTWKGYLFDVLKELKDEGLIIQNMNQQSVLITEKGIEKAKELKELFSNLTYKNTNSEMIQKNYILDITLLLLFMSGWEEEDRNDPDKKIFRTWKGYLFDVLNELKEEGMILQYMNQQSVLITEKGIEKAKELKQKYLG